MKIKVNQANAEQIVEALKAVNGKAYQHAYTTFKEIADIAVRAESVLGTKYLAKRDYRGARVVSVSGVPVANRYKYTRQGTKVVLERGSSDWFLVSVEEAVVFTNGGGLDKLILTEAQKTVALERFKAAL